MADGAARDLAVIDQQHGPLVKVDWLEFGRIKLPSGDNHLVGACRLSGDDANMLSTPEGWRYEGSPTETFGLEPDDATAPARTCSHPPAPDRTCSHLCAPSRTCAHPLAPDRTRLYLRIIPIAAPSSSIVLG